MQNDLNLNNIIEFTDVSKQYSEEKNQAIHGISFSVKEREFVSLIGPSGCGKSTILKLIAGLIEPTKGQIKKPENVSMSFQSGALFPWRTVFDNVALGLQANHASEPKITKEVWMYLEMMRLQDLANAYPADLSGGQRQRVGIARALAVSPSVLLLDEPFSALDPKITAELHDDIIRIWRETKKTLILVSHLIEEAVSLADRILLMKEGAITNEYPIALPYPRREQGMAFLHHVQEIRKDFFSGSE